jgi:chromosome segregation ATPase|tara:strand:- start:432 stop:755 length:324 start_codon:yes stop_codon:yes gene_type:complete
MNSIHEKEKKLQQALEKLNLINPQNLNLKETISNLDQQKNQLEIEKKELETNYEELQQNYQKLMSKIDELNNQKEVEVKKELEFSDKIDELNQETDSLLEEIDKWQM